LFNCLHQGKIKLKVTSD